ncbi:hypothetical protein CI610_00150 [invertebrate metagenome]|uniref:AmpG permease n=1 Tax=invertebrate metagenome TaxID=1711999 RepID=A0A2H9TCC2_9ZZZZ
MLAQRLSSYWQSLQVYRHPKAIALLFLGFSAGLPLMLVFSSLSFWLREAGVARATIGYFSWVGLAYSIKWIWSPLVDRLSLPLLTYFLGRRRSWLLLSQCGVIVGLIGMALTNPAEANELGMMVGMALLVAFSSATQDIVIDAYRIESANKRLQGALAATYMTGYRIAMIASGAGVLAIAAWVAPSANGYFVHAWSIAYFSMAGLMGVGLITTLAIHEPEIMHVPVAEEEKIALWLKGKPGCPLWLVRILTWFYGAVICPFAEFIRRYRWQALLLLALISTYRISDIIMGIMANPFYVDLGFTKQQVATVTKVYGLIMTLLGAGVGGILIARLGIIKMLFTGAFLSAVTNLLFALLATVGKDMTALTLVVSLDNFSSGLAASAFVAWLSSLTNINYSATQYALFSSLMLMLPKFIAGFSGEIVDSVGYVWFFVMTAVIGIPVLLLILLSWRYLAMGSDASSAKSSSTGLSARNP